MMHLIDKLKGKYRFWFKCTDVDNADVLQEITHWDEFSSNDYCIQDDYYDNGIIVIINEEQFLQSIVGSFPSKIEYCAWNKDEDVIWAYDNKGVHWLYK